MAMVLLQRELAGTEPAPEVEARGLVVLFPEPLNQKTEAVLISNGFRLENYTSCQLTNEDFGAETLILVFDEETKQQVLEMEGAKNVYILTDVTGEELEIFDPYGADILTYGICYEALTKTIRRLAEILREDSNWNA